MVSVGNFCYCDLVDFRFTSGQLGGVEEILAILASENFTKQRAWIIFEKPEGRPPPFPPFPFREPSLVEVNS